MDVVLQKISNKFFLIKLENVSSVEWKGGIEVSGVPYLRVAKIGEEVFVLEGKEWVKVFPAVARDYAVRKASALGFRVGI